MKGFSGFPAGKVRTTPVPHQFFTELLPQIDHLGELKVTLYCFWRLALKEGKIRYLRQSEMEADETLMRGLAEYKHDSPAALADALERAVARGTLLHIQVESASGSEDLYFVNTPKGRAAVDGITRGEWRPTGEDDTPVEVLVDRPNAFTLYEQNIGALTPMISEELRDMAETYPAQWIEDAIRVAVKNNVRRLKYILAVLERMRSEGRYEQETRDTAEPDLSRFDGYLSYIDTAENGGDEEPHAPEQPG